MGVLLCMEDEGIAAPAKEEAGFRTGVDGPPGPWRPPRPGCGAELEPPSRVCPSRTLRIATLRQSMRGSCAPRAQVRSRPSPPVPDLGSRHPPDGIAGLARTGDA